MVEKNASFILESALDRIDGILAGNRLDIPWADSSPSRLNLTEAVYRFASTLKEAKESGEFQEVHIPNHEKNLILQFLNCSDQCSGNPEVEERLRRVEGEKDSLQLQVSVLMEQIEAQSDKIAEMEKCMQDKSTQLKRTEEILQKELMIRSQLETQKMELTKELSSLRLRSVSMEKENLLLRAGAQISALESPEPKSPSAYPRVGSPDAASTPMSVKDSFHIQRSPSRGLGGSMDVMPSLERSPMMVKQPRTPPASTFRRIDLSPNMSGTLPRTSLSPTSSRDGSRLQTPKRGVVFGKGLNFFKSVDKRSCSAPNLAETERDDGNDRAPGELSPLSPDSLTTPNLSPNGSVGKNKGIKKLFGRMRRSNSSAFDEPENNFKRGGVRATAGPRLGWVPDNRPTFIEPSTTFSNWDTETIVNWLNNLGLLAAAMEARRWVKKGQQMIDASPSELEKELALKNPLHKKKLLLALEAKGRPINETLRPFGTPAISPSLEEAFATLDHNWVVRWLDDVGLPQYKDLFMESRVDARMLHNLTIEDLCSYLKVSNLLHMTSIKRGIQGPRFRTFMHTD